MNRKRIKTELLVHDLKNPIAVIEASIDCMIRQAEREGPLSEKQVKVLNRVLRNSKIARSLVNDILEVGRSNEGIFDKEKLRFFEYVILPFVEIFDLIAPDAAEKLGTTVTLSEFTEILKNHDIKLNISESLWLKEVFLDIRKVRQVLRNLLSNAVKYRKKEIELNIFMDDSTLVISISDDGKGIAQEYHKKIFDRYFQLGDDRNSCVRGHGLGLAGALILVEDMGGEMLLESETDKGAKFTVKLPLGE